MVLVAFACELVRALFGSTSDSKLVAEAISHKMMEPRRFCGGTQLSSNIVDLDSLHACVQLQVLFVVRPKLANLVPLGVPQGIGSTDNASRPASALTHSGPFGFPILYNPRQFQATWELTQGRQSVSKLPATFF